MFISPCQNTPCHIPQNLTASIYFIILCVLLRQVLSIDSRLVRSRFSFLDLTTEEETSSEISVCQIFVFESLDKIQQECRSNMNNKLQVCSLNHCLCYISHVYLISFILTQAQKVCTLKSTENILRRHARCPLRLSVLSFRIFVQIKVTCIYARNLKSFIKKT